MFAPKPFEVAKEIVRVTRPGGRIVMGNWIPNDPTLVAQILKTSSSYSPPPPEGFVSPMTWGVEDNVLERFAAAGVPEEKISFARDTYTFNYPGTPSELVGLFRAYYGPTMNAFEAAAANGREADLQAELEALFNAQNASPSEDATSIPATFLRVTVAGCDGVTERDGVPAPRGRLMSARGAFWSARRATSPIARRSHARRAGTSPGPWHGCRCH